jgi:tetratricopeptide (TPR) repeat protein
VPGMLSEEAQRGELAVALEVAGGAWERGWVLAAMGRFGEALRLLGEACQGPDAARAHGTAASVYRQLALHDRAEAEDDAGLALVDDPPVEAGLRVGKVADALGLGLRDAWRGRLGEARAAVEGHGDWRQRVRLAWVAGETELYEGDAEAAAPHFAEAVARSIESGARRHEAKSHLFLGAAHATLRNLGAAEGHAEAALGLARQCGARPIEWAARLVLAESGRDPEAHVAQARAALGGIIEGLPGELRAAALTREPARTLLGQAGSAEPGMRRPSAS